MASFGYADNIFTAIIDEQGDIYEASTGRKRQKVGVDGQREQELLNQIVEMQSVIENYYGKLVELGVITPPKSPEQIAQDQAAQQAEINQALLTAISGLQSELMELRNNGSNGSREGSNGQNGRDIKHNRKAAGSSKNSNPTGDKDATGDS